MIIFIACINCYEVKLKLQIVVFGIFLLSFCPVFGQNVTLYEQYNGKYDFIFVGNTMNLGENNITAGCTELLLNSSAAELSLNPNQVIESAYLYWAGSGTGDFSVALNGTPVAAERTFAVTNATSLLPYFSAFADVTSLVTATGNGTYTLSELDVSQALADNAGYCNNRTNFAGWAMVIVYNDPNVPLNQVNIYDGLQGIPPSLTITLTNLNVINTTGAEIGFVAWEGDSNLDIAETLSINGSVMSNPPLNPSTNAFNGTNTFTGSNTLYNMDLDVYNIQNNLTVGNNTAQIQLTSGQDVVLMNVVVTKLNSQLPDASVAVNSILQQCDSRTITFDYTVSNLNATDPLPAGTPIAVYAEGQLVGQSATNATLPIDGSEAKQITLTIPESLGDSFTLKFMVDDDGTGAGIRNELNENNNSFLVNVTLWFSPEFNELEPLRSCNEGFTRATFDFSDYYDFVKVDPSDTVAFYGSLADAENEANPIGNAADYTAASTPMEIFVRIENEHCYSITSFTLRSVNCPPIIYNYVSGNGDGTNDTFTIKGLRNIFVNFELSLYNRWGRLIWTGNNSTPDWDGFSNKGGRLDHEDSPYSTYYYILNLNDEGYPAPLTGFLFYNKND